MSPAAAAWPPVAALRWDGTHRLIPDAHAHTDDRLLAPLTDGDDDVEALVALAGATSRRLLVQQGRIPSGIHADELVFGVPEWPIIDAAYCYPNPNGARFSGPDRGAWYAGREVDTSLAEVVFHKSVELAETQWWELSIVYQDFLADVHGPFHDLRRVGDRRARPCLDPSSYEAGQALAERLLDAGSLGIVYPSVRHRPGEAVACFRPASVGNVRRGDRYRIVWNGRPGSGPTVGPV